MTAAVAPILTFPISAMSDEEKLTALALQGLVNRAGPRLYYYARFWNWPEADDKWIEYLTASRGYTFEPFNGTLRDLVAHFAAAIKGLAVWDPRQEKTKWAAATLAGLRDLLPVAPECIERYAGLPVVEDLRGRFHDKLEPVRWAIDTLLPQCNKTLGYSADLLWSGWAIDAIDYAVRERSFIWALKPGGSQAPAGEVELLNQIHAQLGPQARIMGWAEPELDHCTVASHHDNFIFCAEAPNLSFFAGVPSIGKRLVQPARAVKPAWKLENKHYLTVNSSEGDTPKIHVAMHGGAWHDPGRGSVAWNWGAQPLLLDYFPVLLEYFYETATNKDYFMGGASGAGFVYPNQLPNPQGYFEQVRRTFQLADLHETEAWLHFSRPVYDEYARTAGLRGISMPCGPYGVTLVNNGKSAVFLRGNSGLNYFNAAGSAMDMTEAIRRHCARRQTPSFTTIHIVPDNKQNPTAQGGYAPSHLAAVQEALGLAEYEFVTMQQLSELAIEAVASGRTPDCFSPGYNEWA